jgi:hypothetical protein
VYIARIDVIIWAELNAMRALHAVHQGSYHHMQCAKYYDHCTGIRTSYYLYISTGNDIDGGGCWWPTMDSGTVHTS